MTLILGPLNGADSKAKRILKIASFWGPGCEGGIFDVTFASESLAPATTGEFYRTSRQVTASPSHSNWLTLFVGVQQPGTPLCVERHDGDHREISRSTWNWQSRAEGRSEDGSVSANIVINSVMNPITTVWEAAIPSMQPSMYWWTAVP